MADARLITPAALQAALHDGGEIALLDVREDGEFGEDHMLFATPLPYSRLELGIASLVPRKSVRIVLCDDGRSGMAQHAASRLAALGYTEGQVKALISLRGDPVARLGAVQRAGLAFEQLELLVALTDHEDETTARAHYVLPLPSAWERADVQIGRAHV
jgi:rhodanese-related sulfurtransferase